METLGTLKARIGRWCRESIEDDLLTDAANDGMEHLWLSIVTVNMSSFMGGPISSVTFAPGDERQTIISVPNPTVAPTLGNFLDGALAARTLTAAYSIVTESGSQTLASPTASFLTTINNVLQITSPAFVAGAYGWYPYVADTTGRLARQSDAPLPFDTPWIEETTGVVDVPGAPGIPTQNNTADDIVYIKVLEIQNINGTYTRWQGAALEDLMMQRAEQTINPAGTTYAPYCYDLVNGNTFEIRPAASQTLNPRFFYTKRPRRLAFPNSIVPFQQYAGAIECICDYAVGKVQMSLKEFDSAKAFMATAMAAKQDILIAANLQNRQRVSRITPYMR